LKSGEAVTLPNVRAAERPPVASAVEVDLGAKTVSATDAAGRVVAAFHCSVAKDPARFPRGSAKIAAIAHNPDYTFDPRMWPEVKDVRRKLTIPPGPRNPVGLCWIGMNLPGYGIHGTPAPELIGKTGSHGCIRLANWDVLRLSEMVRIGTPVRFLRS
jgi:lipoprotein-anchoring transpeptidase ErfK/SrfK